MYVYKWIKQGIYVHVIKPPPGPKKQYNWIWPQPNKGLVTYFKGYATIV